MKKVLIFFCLFFCAKIFSQAAIYEEDIVLEAKDYPDEVTLEGYSHPYRWNKIEGGKVQFKEIWGYVLAARLEEWDKKAPLTDIGLFSVDIDCYGKLEKAPPRYIIKDFDGRVHLVATCSSKSLSHFVLDPKYGVRVQLIKDLIKATEGFDGLQIDYELVPKEDSENFADFLRILKKKLGEKTLTVCVPARVKSFEGDVYDYKRLSEICDKVMIMAYDEHWSTSGPGSVASVHWCKRIQDYALNILPPEKYIIGAPFYGRSWAEKPVAQAWYFNGANRIMNENGVNRINRKDGIPYFEYEAKVKVTLWYDDATSLVQRARMYRTAGFTNIAFWRMGQEDAEFWNWIEEHQ